MENTQTSSKKNDIPIILAIVYNSESTSHFSFAVILKKSKKIDVILPIIAEFQILEIDSLNFEVFWDYNAVINEKFA